MPKKAKNNKLILNLIISIELILIGIFSLAISVSKFTNGYQNFINNKDAQIFWVGFLLVCVMIISTVMIISALFSSLISCKKIQEDACNKGKKK